MKTTLAIGTAAAVTLFASNAMAASPTGFYIHGDVGAAFHVDSTETDTDPNNVNASLGSHTIPSTSGTDVVLDGGAGYRFSPLFRLEETLSYLPQHVKGTFNPPGTPGVTSTTAATDVNSFAAMTNAYIDLDRFTGAVFGYAHPFVLGGVGVAVNQNETQHDYTGGAPKNNLSGDTQAQFAWNAGAGFGIPLSNHMTFDVTYKYMDLGERQTGTSLTNTGGSTISVTPDKADLAVHTISVGLRCSFE